MDNGSLNFRFAEDIYLETNSLIEAWLEIQWHLDETSSSAFATDPGFDIAIGQFNHNVRDKFPDRKPLGTAQMPTGMLPHIVRYQFRNGDDGWPLLQLGPGVASVNFTTSYEWSVFRKAALYLREQRTKSYEYELKTKALVLRYRNSLPFNYKSTNLIDYLAEKLHISIQHPASIPGTAGSTGMPNGLNFAMSFELREDIGVGTVKISTGKKNEDGEEQDAVIFDLQIAANETNPPTLNDPKQFDDWLSLAHRVVHDWYFSLIDGDLRSQFGGN